MKPNQNIKLITLLSPSSTNFPSALNEYYLIYPVCDATTNLVPVELKSIAFTQPFKFILTIISLNVFILLNTPLYVLSSYYSYGCSFS